MYRHNDYISCLSVSAYKINKSIEVEAFKSNSDIDIFAKKASNSPIVTCSLVCSVSNDAYLDVNPDYVWLTPDMLSSGEFDIISNVNWIID